MKTTLRLAEALKPEDDEFREHNAYDVISKASKEVVEIFERYPDKPAVGLIKILIDRACGK